MREWSQVTSWKSGWKAYTWAFSRRWWTYPKFFFPFSRMFFLKMTFCSTQAQTSNVSIEKTANKKSNLFYQKKKVRPWHQYRQLVSLWRAHPPRCSSPPSQLPNSLTLLHPSPSCYSKHPHSPLYVTCMYMYICNIRNYDLRKVASENFPFTFSVPVFSFTATTVPPNLGKSMQCNKKQALCARVHNPHTCHSKS